MSIAACAGRSRGPDWRTQLLPVRQCHVPSPSHIAAKLPQFPNAAFTSCSDRQGELLDPRRVEPPRKVWLFPLPLLPQKPGCRRCPDTQSCPAGTRSQGPPDLSFVHTNERPDAAFVLLRAARSILRRDREHYEPLSLLNARAVRSPLRAWARAACAGSPRRESARSPGR